jgi:hypothetical protein
LPTRARGDEGWAARTVSGVARELGGADGGGGAGVDFDDPAVADLRTLLVG